MNQNQIHLVKKSRSIGFFFSAGCEEKEEAEKGEERTIKSLNI